MDFETNKICTSCGLLKPLSDFYTDKTHHDGHSSNCKECRKLYCKEKYRTNPNAFLERNKAYRKTHKEQIAKRMNLWSKKHSSELMQKRKYKYSKRSVVVENMKTPCQKCGDERMYVIDFHHINPNEKSYAISVSRSEESIISEAKKCICLCRNCHQEFHYLYGKKPINPEQCLTEYLKEN